MGNRNGRARRAASSAGSDEAVAVVGFAWLGWVAPGVRPQPASALTTASATTTWRAVWVERRAGTVVVSSAWRGESRHDLGCGAPLWAALIVRRTVCLAWPGFRPATPTCRSCSTRRTSYLPDPQQWVAGSGRAACLGRRDLSPERETTAAPAGLWTKPTTTVGSNS